MYNNQQEDSLESEKMRKIFAGSLDRTTTDDSFTDYFSQFGEVESSGIIRDANTRESRGCGFVTYANSDIVENVLQSRPHSIDNKTVDVKRAIPKDFEGDAARAKTMRLFVAGFKYSDLTEGDLTEYLESRHPTSYGTIEKIEFVKDRNTGESRGFGFITCSSFDFADRLAIAEVSFNLKGKRMTIKKAEERDSQSGGGMRGGGMRGGGMHGGGMRGGRSRGGRGGSSYGNSYGRDNSYNQDNSYNKSYNNSYDTSYPSKSYGGGNNWNSGGNTRYQPY